MIFSHLLYDLGTRKKKLRHKHVHFFLFFNCGIALTVSQYEKEHKLGAPAARGFRTTASTAAIWAVEGTEAATTTTDVFFFAAAPAVLRGDNELPPERAVAINAADEEASASGGFIALPLAGWRASTVRLLWSGHIMVAALEERELAAMEVVRLISASYLLRCFDIHLHFCFYCVA